MSRIGLSEIAFHVSHIPRGNMTRVEVQTAGATIALPVMAYFSPVIEIIWKMMKMKADITTGRPSPPFLTMAPSGAPMKKNNKQAIERVNF